MQRGLRWRPRSPGKQHGTGPPAGLPGSWGRTEGPPGPHAVSPGLALRGRGTRAGSPDRGGAATQEPDSETQRSHVCDGREEPEPCGRRPFIPRGRGVQGGHTPCTTPRTRGLPCRPHAGPFQAGTLPGGREPCLLPPQGGVCVVRAPGGLGAPSLGGHAPAGANGQSVSAEGQGPGGLPARLWEGRDPQAEGAGPPQRDPFPPLKGLL